MKKILFLLISVLLVLLFLSLSNAASTCPLSNVIINPVVGERSFNLSVSYPCSADHVKLSWCEGNSCTSFNEPEEFPATNNIIYKNDLLEWSQDYTFKVVPYYASSGSYGNETITVANIGDIECWNQKSTNAFCISTFYYEGFRNYLQSFGFGSSSSTDFINDFEQYVDLEFNRNQDRMNKAWSCNANNVLSRVIDCNQNPGQLCASGQKGVGCKNATNCNFVNIFGLYTTQDQCENSGNNYCFFDKWSVTNKCYSCNSGMSCVDYKTRDTCARDNCNAGSCEWHDTFSLLGAGTCVDRAKNNCVYCDKSGTGAVESQQAHNKVLDSCSNVRANSLTTINNQCVYDVQFNKATLCGQATCSSFESNSCGTISPVLNTLDNSLTSRGTDPCNLGVCIRFGVGCVKDADGDGNKDCTTSACEQDVYTPETKPILSTNQGIAEIIDFKIFDKENPEDLGRYHNETGYRTRFCLLTSTQKCDNTNNYPTEITTGKLIVSNKVLKDFFTGTKYADLQTGANTLRFYSLDAANNREIVKNITFSACDTCSRPILTSLTITDANFASGIFYTQNKNPTINVKFDSPVELISPRILSSTGQIILTPTKTGLSDTNSFTIAQSLAEGRYTLVADAVNSNKVSMRDPINQEIIIDNTAPRATIRPLNNEVINTKDVIIELEFNEEINPKKNSINLGQDDYSNINIKQINITDISNNLQTDRKTLVLNQSFSDGRKTIYLDVEDNAGNKLKTESLFFIQTDGTPLQMAMVKPPYGATAINKFDAKIETSANATCQYEFDKFPPLQGPTPSSPRTVDNFNEHSVLGLEINDFRPHKLQLFCKKVDCTVNCSNMEIFELRLDKTRPKIIRAYAFPDVIAENETNGEFLTTLRVQTDKPSFCKFDENSQDLNKMTSEFPDYNIIPRTVHLAELRVNDQRNYTYFVSCISASGMIVDKPSTINFKVDLNAPLRIYDTTQKVFSTKLIELKAQTNKRAMCTYNGVKNGKDVSTPTWFTNSQGYTIESRYFSQNIDATNLLGADAGEITYKVKCTYDNFATGTKEQAELLINTIIDTTEPDMKYVDVTSPLGNFTSYYLDRIQVAMLAEDKESGISHYYYRVRTAGLNQSIADWTRSDVQDGKKFFILYNEKGKPINLVDNTEYAVDAKAVNKAGIQGVEMSDFVEINTSLAPDHCSNQVWDWDKNELDIDCGGTCSSCKEGQNCNTINDCDTEFDCDSATNKCIDLCTNECKIGERCKVNHDCESNKCENNLCAENPCGNSKIDVPETDFDCGGGSCGPCAEGKTCVIDVDCQQGLICDNKSCTRLKDDSDSDGITDRLDDCSSTPRGETVDAKGCSDSQRFTCKDDINDAWRRKYFGGIACGGDGAENADPDKDGLNNLDEFKAGTDPKNKDSDGDGYNDGDEVKANSNPLDKDSKPAAWYKKFATFGLVLLIIGGIVLGGFFGLKIYQERKIPAQPPTMPPSLPPREIGEEKFRQVREKLEEIRKQKPKEEYVGLEEIKEELEERQFKEKPELAIEKLRKFKEREENK